jgi:hypothetical protein
MSIEKKSLISNRIASKKAIVTKPEATKTVSSRVASHTKAATRVAVKPTAVSSHPSKVAGHLNRIAIGRTHLSLARIKAN